MTRSLYLLDTSALLAHCRREAGWQDVQALFENSDAGIFVASVSLPEFARRLLDLGASVSEANQTLDDYLMLMSEVVSVDSAVAREAVLISTRTPERLPLIDALIAAAARARDATLVHRDKHMAAIPPDILRRQRIAEHT